MGSACRASSRHIRRDRGRDGALTRNSVRTAEVSDNGNRASTLSRARNARTGTVFRSARHQGGIRLGGRSRCPNALRSALAELRSVRRSHSWWRDRITGRRRRMRGRVDDARDATQRDHFDDGQLHGSRCPERPHCTCARTRQGPPRREHQRRDPRQQKRPCRRCAGHLQNRMSDLLDIIRNASAPYGLNLVAAIPADRYDLSASPMMRASAIFPDARSIVVIGNGGGAFWRAFTAHAMQHPGWRERDNPLDDFTREVVERDIVSAARSAGVQCTPVYPFMSGSATLNFMELARMSGLAGPSILGVVVHPEYGPWIAFRVALLLDAELDES